MASSVSGVGSQSSAWNVTRSSARSRPGWPNPWCVTRCHPRDTLGPPPDGLQVVVRLSREVCRSLAHRTVPVRSGVRSGVFRGKGSLPCPHPASSSAARRKRARCLRCPGFPWFAVRRLEPHDTKIPACSPSPRRRFRRSPPEVGRATCAEGCALARLAECCRADPSTSSSPRPWRLSRRMGTRDLARCSARVRRGSSVGAPMR